MELKLSADKHKEIVKLLWDKSRVAEEVMNSLVEIGFTCIEGKLIRVMDWAYQMLELVCQERLFELGYGEQDEFLNEFLYGVDFETFYANWFEDAQ